VRVADAQAAVYAALAPLAGVVDDLQVYGYLNANPTPPSIDVYPGDPFMDGAGFGSRDVRVYFTVRARVSTADQEAGQQLLLRLLDVGDEASVQVAIEDADAGVVAPEGTTGFREYIDDTASNGRLLGCEWRVSTFLDRPMPG
jgi:hypothetical protein